MGKVIKGQSKNDAWNDDDIPVIAAPSKQDSWSDDDIPVISAAPQKKSPDPSAGGLPVSSTPGQNGSPTSDVPQKQIVELPTAPDPLTGLPTEAMTPVATPQEKTEQATKYIANHYLQNVGAPQGMQVNAPEHPLNQLTDPHGDPSYLSSYVKSNLARLQQKQTANVGASENMGGVPEYLQSINQEREDLLNNAGQIMRQQLFAKEVQQKKYDDHSAAIQIDVLQKQQGADIKDIDAQIEATNKWEHPNGVGAMQERSRLQDKKKSIQEHYGQQMQSVRENTKYNPIMIGAEYAANMGNPQAEKDLEALRQGRSINPASQYAYNQFGNKVIQDGTDAAVNDKAKQEGEEHADRSGNQLYENNKPYIIQQAANTIGNAKYEDTNPLMNAVRMVIPSQILPGASKDDIQKYGEENGLDQKVIDELKKDPSQIPKQASLLQQFGRGLFNAAAPIYETGVRTAGHVFGGNAEAINEAFTPGWENQRGVGAVIAGNTPTDQNSFHNVTGAIGQIFEGAGNLATFAGEVGGTAKGLEGLGMTEKGAEKLANFGVMTLQGYNDSYKHSLELFGDKPEDEGKRQAFSLINGIIGGAIFSHTPKYQPIKDALGKVSKSGEQLIEEMQANGGTDFLETKVGKDKLTAYVQKFGSEMGTQVKLATAQKISEGIVTTLAAPDAKQDIPEDVKNTAISTMLTMLIPSILGAKGHVDMQSPLNHAAMFEMGSNPDKYINFIGQQLRDGKITPEQAQMSHDAILKMKNVIANTPTTTIDKEGNTVPLSPDQIKAYSYSLFQEDLQQKKLEDLQKSATTANLPVDKAQEAPLKKKISELQKQRDEILAKPAPAIIAPNQERSVATDAQPEGQAFAVKEKLDDDFYKFYQEYYQPHRSLDEIKEGWYDSHKMSPEEWSEDHKDFYNQPHSEKSENWPKLHSEVNKLHQRYKDLKKSSETEIPEEGSVIKWDRYGNEEENDWTVGKRVKTRGGQEAVELSREYEDGGGKSTVTHVVTLEDLQKKSSEKEGNSENKNIPLSPQVGSQQKTPQDEKTNGESGQNEAGHQGAPNESRKEAGIQGNDDYQAGQERGRQGRSLNETEEGNKAEATPKEQPIPVSGRKRRKLVAEEEPVQQKEYAAMDYGTEAGKPAEEVDKKVKAASDDEKIGGGESFNEFKDRIQKAWENTKKTAEDKTQFMMHSTVMRLVEAAERVGWDSPKLREEFNKEKEPEAATKKTYKLDNNKGEIDLYRHAETEDGKNGLTRTPETPLTEKGKGEAKEIAADIKDNGIAPPAIVAGGDEVRTGHTAAIVAKNLEINGLIDELKSYKQTDTGVLNLNEYQDMASGKKIQDLLKRISKHVYGDPDKVLSKLTNLGVLEVVKSLEQKLKNQGTEPPTERRNEVKPEPFTDEGHPIFKEGQEQDEAIRNADMTQDEKDLLDNIWDKHTLDNGKLNVSKFVDELQENRDKFGKDVQNVIDKLLPFNTDEENEPYIKELRKKIEDYERANNQGANEEAPAEPKDNGSPSNGKPGEPKEGGGQEPAATPAGDKEVDEKPNQVPETNGAIATDDAKKNEGLDKKEQTPEEKQISDIDLQLLKERTSQKDIAKRRDEATKKKDIPTANKHNEDWYKKQEKIDKLNEQRADIVRNQEIKQEWNDRADKFEANRKKFRENMKDVKRNGYSLPEHVADYINGRIADGIRELGNLHVAIRRAIRLAKEKFGKEADGFDERKAREFYKKYDKAPEQEPDLPTDQREYAHDLLADIEAGVDANGKPYTYADAEKEVSDEVILNREGQPVSDAVAEKNKAKILNYIKYHTEPIKDMPEYIADSDGTVSIKNEFTRAMRAKLGLGDEIPADEKHWVDVKANADKEIEKYPDTPKKLVDYLEKHPGTAVTDEQNYIVTHHLRTLNNNLEKLIADINNAGEQGDTAEVLSKQTEMAATLDEIKRTADVSKAIGTTSGRALASRRMELDRRYDIANMLNEKRASANDGKPLSPEQIAEVQKLHDEIKRTREELDAYKQKEAAQKAENDLNQKVAAGGKVNSKDVTDIDEKTAKKGAIKDRTTADSELKEQQEKIKDKSKNVAKKMKERGEKKSSKDMDDLKNEALKEMKMKPQDFLKQLRDKIKKGPC